MQTFLFIAGLVCFMAGSLFATFAAFAIREVREHPTTGAQRLVTYKSRRFNATSAVLLLGLAFLLWNL